MTKTQQLLSVFANTVRVGGGIHTTAELAFMMGEPNTPAFTKFLTDCVRKGVVRRVVKGVFESVLTPPEASTAIYQIIKKLRGAALTYISLESQLNFTGDISQLVMDRVTVITKGRSGIFTTPYGVIEFTHTKKPIGAIAPNLYLDTDIGMYGAIAAVIEKEVLHHDIMDVLIKQRGTAISAQLVDKKLEARGKEKANSIEALGAKTERLMRDDEVRTDFNAEIARFLPNQIKMRTIDDPDYWAYLQSEVSAAASALLAPEVPKNRFDMGL